MRAATSIHGQRRGRPARYGQAFTLVEMLVVIAIIGILAALLMPAMQKALDSAYQVKCTNNQKQLYLGFSQYADENRGFFPPGNQYFSTITINGTTRTAAYVPWLSVAFIGKYIGNTQACSSAFGNTPPNTEILYCPVRKSIGTKTGNDLGIGYNQRYANYFTYGGPYVPLQSFKTPSKLLVTLDVVQGPTLERLYENESGYGSTSWPLYRHGGTANVLFADGHLATTFDLPTDLNAKRITRTAK